MRRYAVITVATAAAVIGAGTAFGSAQQNDPGAVSSPPPASSIKDTLVTKCEQDGDKIRRENPGAYVSSCNYGEGTLTVP